ncbi:MAG: hypothetical protein R3E93_12855 [Thiothrix sp.]
MSRLNEEEAARTLALLEELGDMQAELDMMLQMEGRDEAGIDEFRDPAKARKLVDEIHKLAASAPLAERSRKTF